MLHNSIVIRPQGGYRMNGDLFWQECLMKIMLSGLS